VRNRFQNDGEEFPTSRPYTPVTSDEDLGHVDLLIKVGILLTKTDAQMADRKVFRSTPMAK